MPDFDLSPDPRILPMLGEINLQQWQCLAELIDNSVDGFLAAMRTSSKVEDREVVLSIPTQAVPGAKLSVVDNGPGMDSSTLEQAVRAGWSGNNPIDSLGLFGMGFNIATARLGTRTTVWTTRENDAVWFGLCIDFEALVRHRTFKTQRLERPKVDPLKHGTEVTVEGLKPEQLAWFSKAANRSRLQKELSRVYTSMLRSNGVPIAFKLTLNNTKVEARNHCVWDADRSVSSPKYGTVAAVQRIDVPLSQRGFCLKCWQWLPAEESKCITCDSADNVRVRARRVHGWIGVQRYLSTTDFGIDFLRNGRKIEFQSKELFYWRDGETEEIEYPIDDPRNRGRLVGEIHLDHCRVHYTKDRFDRNDPAWEDMVRAVRGLGPLRPEKARSLGFTNDSPLSTLFNTFRRSSPKPRIAGAWRNLLVVSDNGVAEQMAERFYLGQPEYIDDSKWYELIEEEERALLTQGQPTPGPDVVDDILGNSEAGGPGEKIQGQNDSPERSASPSAPTIVHRKDRLPSLTKEYIHDGTNLRWDVRAWSVDVGHPDLNPQGAPWKMKRSTEGFFDLFLAVEHDMFRSSSITILDATLYELAFSAIDTLRGRTHNHTVASVLNELRHRYAASTNLDPVTLSSEAQLALAEIAKCLPKSVQSSEDGSALFAELSSKDQEDIRLKMAARQVREPELCIAQGRFLEFATNRTLVSFFQQHPELFFDGKCFDTEYATLDYGLAAATSDARLKVVNSYLGLLADAVWLADQDPIDLGLSSRQRLLRAALALELLSGVSSDED